VLRFGSQPHYLSALHLLPRDVCGGGMDLVLLL
jgi:hypothetical protein